MILLIHTKETSTIKKSFTFFPLTLTSSTERKAMSLSGTNISHEIPFVALAMQTQQEINSAYMRKMNRDYAAYIPNPFTTSISTISIDTSPRSNLTPINETRIEQESS